MTWDHDALRAAAADAEAAVPRLEGLADPVVSRDLVERLLAAPAALMAALKEASAADAPPEVAEAGAVLEAFLLDEVEELPARAPDLLAWLTGASSIWLCSLSPGCGDTRCSGNRVTRSAPSHSSGASQTGWPGQSS